MDHLPGAGGDLMIVKRRENVLRIASVNAIAVAVEHIHIHKVRPGIDFVVRSQAATASDHLASGGGGLGVHPHFVRIHRALGEGVADLERAQDHFHEIGAAALERRHCRPQRRRQRGVDSASFFDAENVHPQIARQKLPVPFHNVRPAAEVSDPGIRRRKEMVVDFELPGIIEFPRAEVRRLLQRHVAAGAVRHRLFRVIKTARAVAGHTAEEVGVVVILAAQEFFIFVQLLRDADLVTGGTKFRGAHEWFQKGLFVKFRFCLDQLLVDVLEQAIRAVGERIMDWFINRIVRVAAPAVDVRDGVA